MYHFTKDRAEHSAETMNEFVWKLEECMTPLHYYLENADVWKVYFIFNNVKIGDELYSFKFTATLTYRKHSGLKEDTLYHDTDPSLVYRF